MIARLAASLVVASTAFVFVACASGPGPAPALACARGQQAMATELLYFGTRKPDGVVTGADWRAFVDAEVTARFPDGLTAWPASGQWRSPAGSLVREDTWVLDIVHASDPASDTAVVAVIDAYKKRFAQQSVLRVSGAACVAF